MVLILKLCLSLPRAIFLAFSLVISSLTTLLAVGYSLPETINPEELKRSSVIIKNGISIGTGVAVSKTHILTGAHNLMGYKSVKTPVQCITFDSLEECYFVPTVLSYTDERDGDYFLPDFPQHSKARELAVKQVHFHPKTRFEEDIRCTDRIINHHEIPENIAIASQYGLESGEAYCSHGVVGLYGQINEDEYITKHVGKVYGPDIAVLECHEPHDIPFLEVLSPPVTGEKTLVHILGLSGKRYENHDSTKIRAGTAMDSDRGLVFSYEPAIYGQRFKCVPGYEDNLHVWLNRVFLKKLPSDTFLMDDQVYPDAPEGFGLLAAGDSGAGAVVIKDGKAYLAGIVSSGAVPAIFLGLHHLLSQINFDPVLAEHHGCAELLNIYKEALDETDRDKKWFITQSLSDVTHIKPWIDEIMAQKKEAL